MTGLVLVIIGAAVIWTGHLAVLPYKPCRCADAGRRGKGLGAERRAWAHCRKCAGKGEMPRAGARIVNRIVRRREI
jgi:hypothetical protein